MDNVKATKKKGSGIIATVITAIICLTMIVMVISAAVHAIRGKLVSFFGYSFSVVGSGSMAPTINVGDAIVVKKVNIDTIKVDDIIVYYNDELKINIVHRVVRTDDEGALVTQGDNRKTNPVEDKIHTTKENFVGIVTKYGDVLGAGSILLINRSMIFVVIIIVFLAFIALEVANFIKALKEKEIDELKAKKQEAIDARNNFNYEEEKAKLREELLKELGMNKENE